MELGKDLTKRQQEIFEFIKKYSAKYGYPPTVRDIGKAVGLASSSTVHAHLANLEKVGLLRRDPAKPRAIELLDRAVGAVKEAVVPSGLPLVGHVVETTVREPDTKPVVAHDAVRLREILEEASRVGIRPVFLEVRKPPAPEQQHRPLADGRVGDPAAVQLGVADLLICVG